MERNYYERCYIAFYWTLEHLFLQSKASIAPHPFSLCDLLSNMCPFTFDTGMSADPADYFDYETILKRIVVESSEENVSNGYRAGCEFLQMYMTEYEYELGDTLSKFSLEDFSLAYEEAKEEGAK